MRERDGDLINCHTVSYESTCGNLANKTQKIPRAKSAIVI